MQQFNFPTTIFYGQGSLQYLAKTLSNQKFEKLLLVSDQTLNEIGIVSRVKEVIASVGIDLAVFCDVHPNPIEQDVLSGVEIYKKEGCQGIIALGGGSPMDAAKAMLLLVDHPTPLAQYDDAKGGDSLITRPLPPSFAIATTAGTGSEVGRASVIIIEATNNKTIFFHPTMLPQIAVLEPELTKDLPPSITVATGLDAFTHSLEAYFAPGFHPMADGIALQSIELILDHLPLVYSNGHNLESRGKMLMAATMGATAFQKGLGMIHSMAHPLSSECHLHHGLANALCLPYCVKFLEGSSLNLDQQGRIKKIWELFKHRSLAKDSLSETCMHFFKSLGIDFGLSKQGVKAHHIDVLTEKAFLDGCHQTNMIPVTKTDFNNVFQDAL